MGVLCLFSICFHNFRCVSGLVGAAPPVWVWWGPLGSVILLVFYGSRLFSGLVGASAPLWVVVVAVALVGVILLVSMVSCMILIVFCYDT